MSPARSVLRLSAIACALGLLAACGGDPQATSSTTPAAELPSGPTAPPPARTAAPTNGTPPATTTMPPVNARPAGQ